MTVSNLATMVDKALEFIETSEAQEILKVLAQHGMGIQMLHVHPSSDLPEEIKFDQQGFAPIPEGYVVVEKNCQISFLPRSKMPDNTIPTSWSWDGVSATCISYCYPIQSGGHNTKHQSQ